jgi:hypothetical protein
MIRFCTGVIDAPQHDVRVRMVGVEMIDRDPIEPGAEIMLGLGHQPTDVGFEVGIFHAVLGRHDEAELVTIAIAPRSRNALPSTVSRSARIEFARRTLARDAVTLDVAQVRARARQPLAAMRTSRVFTIARRARNAGEPIAARQEVVRCWRRDRSGCRRTAASTTPVLAPARRAADHTPRTEAPGPLPLRLPIRPSFGVNSVVAHARPQPRGALQKMAQKPTFPEADISLREKPVSRKKDVQTITWQGRETLPLSCFPCLPSPCPLPGSKKREKQTPIRRRLSRRNPH